MSSSRKIATNRRNARRSTGPRSAAGKACSSRNALRHGLAISLASLPEKTLEIEQLARTVAGEDAKPARLHYARIAAEAELELLRVRAARVALINQYAQDRLIYAPPTNKLDFELRYLARFHRNPKLAAAAEKSWHSLRPPIPEDPERMFVALTRAIPDLAKYDRYERRALSRRKRALRALDAMRGKPAVAATG